MSEPEAGEGAGAGGERGESPGLGGCGAAGPPAADSPATATAVAASPLCSSPPSPPAPEPDDPSPTPARASVARHVPPRPDHLAPAHHPPLSLATHHNSPDPDDPDDDPDLQPRILHTQTVALHHPEDDSELSPSAHVNYKDEPLSVSVVHEDSQLDSHDSGLLSPSELSPREGQVSVPSMIDASDFRSLQPEPIYQNLSSMNGRMSPPGFSPSSASSYATLTPLQPLPPISTVSDKFAYGHAGNVSGSFTVMQNNGLGNMLSMGSPYQYDKLSMSPPHYTTNNGLGLNLGHQHSPLSPHSYQNGLASPQKSLSPNGYDSPYTRQDMSRTTLAAPQSPTLSPPVSLHSPPQAFSNFSAAPTPTLTTTSLNMNGLSGGSGLGSLSPQAVSPHSPNYSPHHHLQVPPSPPPIKQEPTLHSASLGCQLANMTPTMPTTISQSPPHAHMAVTMAQQAMVPTAPMSVATASVGGPQVPMKTPQMATTSAGSVGAGAGEVEEINTKELAQRISAELKRYSIPQAIFAQRVLCRSQGTLSDLLRNPKPWSKLKSGRETFRRMWKWLQEPEFQRMSALRLAASMVTGTSSVPQEAPPPPASQCRQNYGGYGYADPSRPTGGDPSYYQAGFQDCQSRNSRAEPGKRVSSSTISSSSSSSSSSHSSSASSSSSPSSLSSSKLPPGPPRSCPPQPRPSYPPTYPAHAHAQYQAQAQIHAGQAHGLAHGPPQTQTYGACYLGSAPPHHFAQPSSSTLFSPYNRYLQKERGTAKPPRAAACAQEATSGFHGFTTSYTASYF
ncbi:nascent polypeptide-associated complex subunit alpha, muscle-specific form-like isoform X3 [Eriocheir sinensis]|uniref:nascent polypeptide-associated complex subunit alpha, muscle-specific form-like isoform X3 n=1 Tax=Eriocheir sinensis TaxID=95602 RepID=UPI0021CAC5FA|nr:nascent polypeptide-associated complex subunit alpha, muscle-specific form-like isoform X3 [Eriocheir sinensis]